MNKRHRIFIAINLPADVKRALFSYSAKHEDFPAKWVIKDNLHITLEFLGETTDQEIGDVCQAVKEVAERHKSFNLNLNKISYGPENKIPPKMIWASGDKSEELADLRYDLENELTDRVSFFPEKKAFSPHITLAQINSWSWKIIEPEENQKWMKILIIYLQ